MNYMVHIATKEAQNNDVDNENLEVVASAANATQVEDRSLKNNIGQTLKDQLKSLKTRERESDIE